MGDFFDDSADLGSDDVEMVDVSEDITGDSDEYNGADDLDRSSDFENFDASVIDSGEDEVLDVEDVLPEEAGEIVTDEEIPNAIEADLLGEFCENSDVLNDSMDVEIPGELPEDFPSDLNVPLSEVVIPDVLNMDAENPSADGSNGLDTADIPDQPEEDACSLPHLSGEQQSLMWERGLGTIENNLEAVRDDLRDKGMEDGEEMEAIIDTDRADMITELSGDLKGEPIASTANEYAEAADESFAATGQDFLSITPETPEALQDISEPKNADTDESLDTNDDQTMEMIETTNIDNEATDTVELVQEDTFADQLVSESEHEITDLETNLPELTDTDIETVYEGENNYDFGGIDYSEKPERLDTTLDSFQQDTWDGLNDEERKEALNVLSNYVKDVIGFKSPPTIEYYNSPIEGDYGGYSPSANTLSVNEYMLHNSSEAADTIAHELWHAHQHECAETPRTTRDLQYQYGFDNYVSYKDDFDGYQSQLVESEARAFAQQFKDRLALSGRKV